MKITDLDPEILAEAAADWGSQNPIKPLPGFFDEMPDEWLNRFNRNCEMAKSSRATVVLLGDSITEAWSDPAQSEIWTEYFQHLPAVNLAIGGDRTQQLLWRLDHGEMNEVEPKVIAILIGVNNLWAMKHSASEVSAGIRAVIEKIKIMRPSAKILLQGIFPTGETPDNPLRAMVTEINAEIQHFADGKTVTFLDLGHLFLEPDGTIKPSIMPDFCHLTPASYRTWAKALEKPLKSLLEN